MAKKKTSAEMAREQSELAKVEGMLGDAFGSLGGLEQSTDEEVSTETSNPAMDKTEGDGLEVTETSEANDSEAEMATHPNENEDSDEHLAFEAPPRPHNGPPSGPPSEAPSGPPSGPPSAPPSKGPPSGPPSEAPSGPPSGPSSAPPSKGPPSAPPSKGPPPSPPTEAPDNHTSSGQESDSPVETDEPKVPEQVDEDNNGSEENDSNEVADDAKSELEEDVKPNEESNEQDDAEPMEVEAEKVPDEEPTSGEENDNAESEGDIQQKEAEIARLAAEVERLRSSMIGAAEVIEELENPPMPPIVEEDVVIGAHTVADIARMARQLDRDELVRASMGAIAMLHPESPEVLISTKHSAMLPRMNEKDICAGKLGGKAPRGAPEDWRVLEVLLASASLVTGGPAAVIHAHGPYTTAVSCEQDLVLMQPIDEIGKEQIGKIIIVDPDSENPEEFLRQVAEALQQGGMRCVVVRGKGAYAVGADLDQAWANAAMLEHSMKIVMLARQANLKV
jgi:ribulose-5-phosphate 4-epimerase/fuculose-1-phosphate aldolase